MEYANWREPTGIRTIKKGKREFYQATVDPDGTRFVNTNRRCKHCPSKGRCYIGRHAIVMACPGEESDR